MRDGHFRERESKPHLLVLLFISSLISVCVITEAYAYTFSYPTILPGESQNIQVVGSTVNIKGITNQDNTLTINGRHVTIQKDGSFHEDIIIPLGDTEIIITVLDKRSEGKTYTKKITAKKNHFFMVGLADGTLNLSNTTDDSITWERDGKHYKNKPHQAATFNADGKISYYLAGKVLGKVLIKSSLDTDKATQEKLFTYIDPDKYYPIYGDNSTVVYDVNSQGKFYILVEMDKSGFTFGNYQTQISDEDAKLAAYNRTLYGGKVHLESTQRTVYGEPMTRATLFAAQINQHAAHNEFLASGGSLYYLRHRNIVEGSEQVRLDIRDKNSGMTVYSVPKSPFKDYTIKYDEGRIIFNDPVLSQSPSDTVISSDVLAGNPVYIVINYEYTNQDAFPTTPENLNERTGGFRISQTIGDNIKLGTTYIQEQEDETVGSYKLYGFDGALRMGNFTKVIAEFAETTQATIPIYVSYNGGYDFTKVDATNGVKGKAFRILFNTNIGEYLGAGREFLDLSGYWQYIGDNFITSDSLFQAGTEKYGIELAHRISEKDKLRFIYEGKELKTDKKISKNDATAERVQNFISQWAHTTGKWGFITEYMLKDRTGSHSYKDQGQPRVRENSVAERVQYQLSKNTSVFVGDQVTLEGSLDNRVSAGFNTKAFKDITLSAEGAIGSGGNSVSAAVSKNIGKDSTIYMNQAFADSSIDGKSSTTSFGSNAAINKDAKLRTERQFITSDIRGAYVSDLMGIDYQFSPRFTTALTYQRRAEDVDYSLINTVPKDTVSSLISYIVPDRYKVYSKNEYRNDSDKTWQVLTENSAEAKITQDLFLFGEYWYSIAYREQANDSYSKIDKKQVGLAYRPVKFDWLNLLFKYIRYTDERPDAVTSADGGFLKMHSTSDTWAGEAALDLPWNFQFVEKFAYKYEKTLSYDPLAVIKTPQDLKAILMVHRLNYHLTKKWDAACEYRILQQKGSDVKDREDGFLIEANYLVMKNVALGAGFNFTNFSDDLNFKDWNVKDSKGFFLRLQGRY